MPSSDCRRRWLGIGLALLLLCGVGVMLSYTDDAIKVEAAVAATALPLVSVEPVRVAEQRAYVEAYAEVRPRWAIELKSEVSGAVSEVFVAARSGNRVEQGEPLFRIEDSRYQAELADAEQALREAELAVERAEYTSQVARKQFQSAGRSAPNDFALHLPQLEIARASVKAARARVRLAQRMLAQTVLRAPFSAYLQQRYVSPGQLVMAGDVTARLINDEAYEAVVKLSKSAWQLLDHPLRGQRVSLLDQAGREVGEARVREGGGYLEDKTRHYSLHLEWQAGEAEVLVGDFIKLRIAGRMLSNSLNIPASAVTEDGHVWWVTERDTLARSPATPLYRSQDRVLIEVPGTAVEWQVVRTPLASYLPGLRVQAQPLTRAVAQMIAQPQSHSQSGEAE